VDGGENHGMSCDQQSSALIATATTQTAAQNMSTQATQAQNQTTLNLHGINVDVTFTPYRSGNAQGVEIEIQAKDCSDCRYIQTVSASDHPARVDTERDANGKPISPSYPLYPSQPKPGEFYDSPQRTDKSSSFMAVVSIGKASDKSFRSLGSITYGFSIDAKGKLSVTAPRVATKQEAAGSAAVVRKEVPGFTFQ